MITQDVWKTYCSRAAKARLVQNRLLEEYLEESLQGRQGGREDSLLNVIDHVGKPKEVAVLEVACMSNYFM